MRWPRPRRPPGVLGAGRGLSPPGSVYVPLRRALGALVLLAAPLSAAGAQTPLLAWPALQGASYDEARGYAPVFTPEARRVSGQTVRLRGYLFPVERGSRHTTFVLIPYPLSHCHFCIPGGAASMVEVTASRPVPFTEAPITMEGRFEVLPRDPYGVLYRMTGARLVGS